VHHFKRPKRSGGLNFKPFATLYIDEGHVSNASFDPAVIRPVQSTPLRSLFLIDPLLLSDAADRTAKPDADRTKEWGRHALRRGSVVIALLSGFKYISQEFAWMRRVVHSAHNC
jgi:hypothetical protein